MTLSTTDNLKAGWECNVRVYNPTKANGLSGPSERFCRRATNGAVASHILLNEHLRFHSRYHFASVRM
jgi:hypothetical protein